MFLWVRLNIVVKYFKRVLVVKLSAVHTAAHMPQYRHRASPALCRPLRPAWYPWRSKPNLQTCERPPWLDPGHRTSNGYQRLQPQSSPQSPHHFVMLERVLWLDMQRGIPSSTNHKCCTRLWAGTVDQPCWGRACYQKDEKRKDPGPDDVPAEAWKLLGHRGAEVLTRLFNCASVTVPIWKDKGDVGECTTYHPICLLCHTMKIFEHVINTRLGKIISICPNQCGFVRGSGTTDAIYNTVRLLLERHREKNQPVHMAFLELKKAFDQGQHGVAQMATSYRRSLWPPNAHTTQGQDLQNRHTPSRAIWFRMLASHHQAWADPPRYGDEDAPLVSRPHAIGPCQKWRCTKAHGCGAHSRQQWRAKGGGGARAPAPLRSDAKVPLRSSLCDMNDIVDDKNQYPRRSLYAEYTVCVGH